MYQAPDPQYLPPDYDLSPGSGAPTQGSHWWDLTAPELNEGAFTQTLVYGFFDGKLTFIEPMITLALLKAKTNLSAEIKQPSAFEKPGLYPTRYEITYEPSFAEYIVAMTNLVSR